MRDRRRFGPGPYLLGLRRLAERDGFPFDVPAVEQVERLRLTTRDAAGRRQRQRQVDADRGARRAIGFAEEGGELERWASGRRAAAVLGGALQPVLSPTKPRTGYFLRAESFFNVARYVDSGGDVLARPVALRRRAAARAVARRVVPRARRQGRARASPCSTARAALSVERRARAGRDRRARERRRRAVRHRDALADPARLPGRADLRADEGGHRGVRLRRAGHRAPHARLPRGARALPARALDEG